MDRLILDRCQAMLGHQFKDIPLLERSLTHSSVAVTRTESNERLEFLGDAVLGLVVCQELYEIEENLSEGEMTKIKSLVVSRQICSELADELGMCELLSLGRGISLGGAVPTSVSAAVFESLIGAMYMDAGLEVARQFIIKHLRKHIDAALATEHQQNYKSMLQQYAQRTWNATPDYILLDEKGPAHSRCFEVGILIGGRHFNSAWGNNKKEAEQEAARIALTELGLIEDLRKALAE